MAEPYKSDFSDDELRGYLEQYRQSKRPAPLPAPAPAATDVGGFKPAIYRSLGQTAAGLGQLAGDFIPGVDADNALKRYGTDVVARNPAAINSLADVAENPWMAVKEAAGSAVGFLGPTVATGGAGALLKGAGAAGSLTRAAGNVVGKAGPVVTAALPSYGGIREAQGDDTALSKALALAGAGTVGAIETRFGPQEWALKALSKEGRGKLAEEFAGKSLVGRVGKGAVKGAAIEGAEELVQNPVEQLASYRNPVSEESLSDTGFGAVMGAIGGGVLGGAMHGVSGRRDLTKTASEQPAAAPATQPPAQTQPTPLGLPHFEPMVRVAMPGGSEMEMTQSAAAAWEDAKQYVLPRSTSDMEAEARQYAEEPSRSTSDEAIKQMNLAEAGYAPESPIERIRTLSTGMNSRSMETPAWDEKNAKAEPAEFPPLKRMLSQYTREDKKSGVARTREEKIAQYVEDKAAHDTRLGEYLNTLKASFEAAVVPKIKKGIRNRLAKEAYAAKPAVSVPTNVKALFAREKRIKAELRRKGILAEGRARAQKELAATQAQWETLRAQEQERADMELEMYRNRRLDEIQEDIAEGNKRKAAERRLETLRSVLTSGKAVNKRREFAKRLGTKVQFSPEENALLDRYDALHSVFTMKDIGAAEIVKPEVEKRKPEEKKDAVQKPSAGKGLLRAKGKQPRVEVGLQEVGKGNAKPEKATAKTEVASKETPAKTEVASKETRAEKEVATAEKPVSKFAQAQQAFGGVKAQSEIVAERKKGRPAAVTKHVGALYKIGTRRDGKGDPDAAALHTALVGVTTLPDALAAARKIAKHTWQKQLVDKLLTRPDVQTTEFELNSKESDKINVVGQFDPSTVTVSLFAGGGVDTLLHEAMHARTNAAYESDTEFRAEIDRLFDVAKAGRSGKAYGLKNAEEMIAESFMDANFNDYMRSIADPDAKGKTLWQSFWEAVRKMLGLGKVYEKSLFDALERSIAAMESRQDMVGAALKPSSAKVLNREIVDAAGEGAGEFRNWVESQKSATPERIDNFLLNVMTLTQTLDVYGKYLPKTLKRVVDSINKRAAKRIEYIRRGEEIEKEYQKVVPFEFRDRLHALMEESTREGIYPERTLEQNREAKTVQTDAHAEKYARLRDRWLNLMVDLDGHKKGTAKATEDVFVKMYKHGDWLFNQKLAIIEEQFKKANALNILDAERRNDAPAKARLQADYRAFMTRLGVKSNQILGPYFPLTRFGKYLAVYQSNELNKASADAEAKFSKLAELEKNTALTEYHDLIAEAGRMRAERRVAAGRGKMGQVKTATSRIREIGKRVREIKTEQGVKLLQLKTARTDAKRAEALVEKLKTDVDNDTGLGRHYIVEAFESPATRNRRVDELRKKGIAAKSSLASESDSALMSPVNRAFVNKVSEAMKGTVSAEEAAKINANMLSVMTQLSMSQTLRHQSRRLGISGADKDMFKSFSNMVRSDAGFLSGLEHTPEVGDAMADMDQEAKTSDSVQAKAVANAMKKHIEPPNDYAGRSVEGKLAKFTSVYMLLMNPAYVATNMMQQAFVGVPVLGAHFGMKRAAQSLIDHGGTALRLMNASVPKDGVSFADKVSGWTNFMLDVGAKDGGKPILNAEQQKLVGWLMDKQLIDISLSSDAGIASTTGSTKFQSAIAMLGTAPHLTEVANRIGLALAAQDMFKKTHKQRDGESSAAYEQRVNEFVATAVDRVHLNYSAENEPLLMKRMPYAHIILQFKKYFEGMAFLIGNNVAKAMAGKKPEGLSDAEWAAEKAVARKTLAYLSGMHFAAAGFLGIPAMGTVAAVINAVANSIGDDEDEPVDLEANLFEYVEKLLGRDAAMVITKGLPTLAGVDLSSRVSLGNVLNPVPFIDMDKEGRDWYNNALAQTLGGPFLGGLAPRFVEAGVALGDKDVLKAWEKAAPGFLGSAAKAARMADEGIVTKYGNVSAPSEAFGSWGVAMKAIGFTPTVEAEFRERQSRQMDVEKHYTEVKDDLRKKYIAARKENDAETVAEVRRELGALRKSLAQVNAERRTKGLKPIKAPNFSDLNRAYLENRKYQRQLDRQYSAQMG